MPSWVEILGYLILIAFMVYLVISQEKIRKQCAKWLEEDEELKIDKHEVIE